MIATLDSFFVDEDNPKVNVVQTLSEKIRQRRHQMLVHSYLYYIMDESVISDGKWQEWADELVELQKQKKIIDFYDDVFADWDGSTGMHLPQDDWIKKRAQWLLNNCVQLK